MLLARRVALSRRDRLIGLVWPRSGWRRTGRYLLHRVRRLHGTPHSIAAGFASGAAAALTPWLGLHYLLCLGLTWVTRGSYVAALIAVTVIGAPALLPLYALRKLADASAPLYAALDYEIGSALLGQVVPSVPPSAALDSATLAHGLAGFLWPASVGTLPFAIVVWAVVYLVVGRLVRVFRAARQHRLLARRAALRRIAVANSAPG